MLHFEIAQREKIRLVLFIPLVQEESYSLSDIVEQTYEKYHRPDEVIVVIPLCDKEIFNDSLSSSKDLTNNLYRYGEKVKLSVVAFDERGDLSGVSGVELNSDGLGPLRDELVVHGIRHLASKNQVVEMSPPGSSFIKPSQDQRTEFIATNRLAQSYSECVFVGFCVLSKIKNITQYEKIYIDTSAINHIVLALVNLISRLKESVYYQPKFESFHSYRGLGNLRIPLGEKALILISASSSNNMAKEIHQKWNRLQNEDVITLLSFTESENVLCSLESSIKKRPDSIERYVKRVDEYFTIEHSEPKSVVIKKIHGEELFKWPFKQLYQSLSHACNRPKIAGHKEKELTVDLNEIPESLLRKLDDWWDDIINWHIPVTTKYIITDKTDEFLKKYIESLQTHLTVEVVDFEDVINQEFQFANSAAVLLLPVLGSGDKFIAANRDLRLAGHDGLRVFVTFFHLFKGKSALATFEKSLIFGPVFKKYKFFSKYSINVPARIDKSSWLAERHLLHKHEDLIISTELHDRFMCLNDVSKGLEGKIGVNGRLHAEHLSFTRHFAFWNFEYEPASVQPEAVYLTVASILQSARDNFKHSPEDSLESTPHQQAILSPDNFVRYNDPLLQSCLWRAAKGSELDYSYDETLSDEFVAIMERLSRATKEERGEAFPDLLLAVILGRVVLCRTALERLRTIINELDPSNLNQVTSGMIQIFNLEL